MFATQAKICGGNVKLGMTIGTWSTLYGEQEYWIEYLGRMVCGTCGHHCKGCSKSCYVRKSYRYGSVIKRHALNTLALRESVKETYNTLSKQLSRKKKKFDIVRINQSGELETADQFRMWCMLAEENPKTEFYIYTKAYEIVEPFLLGGIVPSNLTVLISIWHEQGIEEYKKLEHLPNVKGFAYDDGYDYEGNGLSLNTYCKAYDEHGKLDHNITCDKCRKCFNRSENCKCIGCMAH